MKHYLKFQNVLQVDFCPLQCLLTQFLHLRLDLKYHTGSKSHTIPSLSILPEYLRIFPMIKKFKTYSYASSVLWVVSLPLKHWDLRTFCVSFFHSSQYPVYNWRHCSWGIRPVCLQQVLLQWSTSQGWCDHQHGGIQYIQGRTMSVHVWLGISVGTIELYDSFG